MIANDSVTTPHGSTGVPVPAAAKLQPQRRWHRRPSRLIPLGLLAVALAAAAIGGYRTLAVISTVQSLSTPPPELSGGALGGADDVAIDTGPAQEAVRQRQEGQRADQQAPGGDAGGSAFGGDDHAAGGTATPVPLRGMATTTTPSNRDDGESDPTFPLASAATDRTAADAAIPIMPAADGGSTILLMGVDARSGESIDVGVRPDALAVLRLDGDGSCRMLAIPRDSRATLPGYGSSKINHALAVGGIPYELQVVEEYLGIEIDHYGLVDFAAITRIVDSVGGIEVVNPGAFTVGELTFAAGPISLDGERALAYARYRGGGDGDFGRIARQQQVMRAVLDRATDVNLVTFAPRSFSLLADHIRTDVGPTKIIDLGADYLDSCTATSLETSTIPGDVAWLYDDLLGAHLSFVVSGATEIRDRVDWLLKDQ